MMRRIPVLLLLLIASPLALAAPVPKEFKRTDDDAILGTWQVMRYCAYNEDRVIPQTLWRFDGAGKGQFWNSTTRFVAR